MNFLYLVQFLLLSKIANANGEPHCSRYHYEEKLLEKMVRMEIRMEEIERKLQTSVSTDEVITQEIQGIALKYSFIFDFFNNNETGKNDHYHLRNVI